MLPPTVPPPGGDGIARCRSAFRPPPPVFLFSASLCARRRRHSEAGQQLLDPAVLFAHRENRSHRHPSGRVEGFEEDLVLEMGVLLDRFGGLADGIVLGPQPDPADDESVAGLVAALRARGAR